MPRLLTYLAPVYNALLAINPAAPKGAFVALVFLIVMAWRRWFPASWVAYSGMVARVLGITDDDTSKFKELLMHALQGIPAAVIGGVLAVIGTGGDAKASVSLALVALFAPLGHFLMSRYQGKLGTPDGNLPPPKSSKPQHIVFANPRDPEERTPPSLPGARLLGLALVCWVVGGCALLTKQTAKTAAEIAHDLCVMHYGKEKPALSLEDVARTYCKDIDPWMDTILGAEQLGAAKARAAHP